MTRTEMIKEIATRAGKSQKETKEFLGLIQEFVYEEMQKGEDVKIFDSVTLCVKDVPERAGRNPQTGEAITIEAHRAPRAKFGSVIKSLVK